MPRKAAQPKQTKNVKNTVETVVETSVETVETPVTPAVTPVKSVKTKTRNVSKTTPTPTPTTTQAPVSTTEEVSELDKKTRVVITKDNVIEGFTDLLSILDKEIVNIRENQPKSKGIKFLRSFGKKIKVLQNQAVRVMKQKHKSNRKNNTNSGFLKPVKISKDMAKFTGWNDSELKSRVDVTKYICNYIKENNLQNPEDRRQIVADKKLAKLLDYSETDKPLTYYRIQTYMKKHFINPDSAK